MRRSPYFIYDNRQLVNIFVNIHQVTNYKVDGMTTTHGFKSANENTNVSKTATSSVTWDSSAACQDVSYAFHFGTGIVIAIIGILCTLGNALVLYIFARNAQLRTSSNLLIINLTIANFLMALTAFPLFAISSVQGCWSWGFTGCQLYGVATSIASLVAINTLAAISFDRYVAVVRRPSRIDKISKSTIAIIITVIWILSITWSVLPVLGFSMYRLEGMGTSCTFNYVDQSFSNTVFFSALVTFNFFIPLCIIVFSYSKIYISVCQIKREIQTFRRNTVHVNNEIKTALVAVLIIVIFCVTWTPYVVIAFIGVFYNSAMISPSVSMLPNIFAKVCTASNAAMYSMSHPEMRKRIKNLFNYSPSVSHLYLRPASEQTSSL